MVAMKVALAHSMSDAQQMDFKLQQAEDATDFLQGAIEQLRKENRYLRQELMLRTQQEVRDAHTYQLHQAAVFAWLQAQQTIPLCRNDVATP
jgi:FtsZ-binding cell division protein ZapB